LDELAQLDLLVVGQPPSIDALHGLSHARRSNALRYWLKSHHAVIPSAAQLLELLRQLDACRTRGHRIQLRVGQGFVRREGEKLAWYNL
jgi:tRNA(Ile)-lysidine synthase